MFMTQPSTQTFTHLGLLLHVSVLLLGMVLRDPQECRHLALTSDEAMV